MESSGVHWLIAGTVADQSACVAEQGPLHGTARCSCEDQPTQQDHSILLTQTVSHPPALSLLRPVVLPGTGPGAAMRRKANLAVLPSAAFATLQTTANRCDRFAGCDRDANRAIRPGSVDG